ncbi:MAG: NAD(P)/FAD-dependent oxidoreductase [Alphaproteobacteria bacterium]|nr:NAD(P)/FAD-dependent oxidoreductase [Alphaproteobacteria bacterium]
MAEIPHTAPQEPTGGYPRVVIIGAGFGGLAAVQALAGAAADITVIDRHNYHLFQPLLYQVATAALSPADIAWPIRHILRRQKNTTVLLDAVSAIDRQAGVVTTEGGRTIAWDHLIIATGAHHSYFGRDDWEKNAPGIKTIADATSLRQKILLAFERAEAESREHERAALLTFVIVGGGQTGVEMAGAIAELARHSIAEDFRVIAPASARIILVEAGPRILHTLEEKLSANAMATLQKMGVEVMAGSRVEDVDADGVVIDGKHIAAKTVIWAAGAKASPAGVWLGAPADKTGRVIVDANLNVAGDARVFVIGDTAAFTPEGATRPLPGVAAVAKQMGVFAAKRIRAAVEQRKPPENFKYHDVGTVAAIGRNSAIVVLPGLKATGFIGWLLWSVSHIFFLIGLRNRASVMLNWAWNYVTWQRGARLITSDKPEDK